MTAVRIGLLIALFFIAPQIHATPVRTYSLDITFDCVFGAGPECLDALGGVQTGTTYSGWFTIAENVFATDGYTDVGFDQFYFSLADTVWDSTRPCRSAVDPSDYCGSRGFNPQTNEGGLRPWTLLIENHELKNICCGVFGIQDTPFINLFPEWNPLGFPANSAGVTAWYDFTCPSGHGVCRGKVSGQGSYSIHLVSEPETVALMFMGVAFAWVGRRKLLRRLFRYSS
jgi:hypothetical protein